MFLDLQKASVLKRISAALLDLILIAVLATGFSWLGSVVTGYDKYPAKFDEYRVEYEKKYGISFNISVEEFEKLSDEEKSVYAAADEEFGKDPDVVYVYGMMVNMSLAIVSIGILLSCLTLEFVVPLILKNGQTIGKKIFGIALMRTDGVKVSTVMLFVRALLGKYTIEIMIPVIIILMISFNLIGIVGVVILGLIAVLEVALMIRTHTNALIHDLLSGTVAVDMASQVIFDSEEALLEYKKSIHADVAANTKY